MCLFIAKKNVIKRRAKLDKSDDRHNEEKNWEETSSQVIGDEKEDKGLNVSKNKLSL